MHITEIFRNMMHFYEMSDKKYKMMIIRRRFCKRVFLAAITFGVSFYISVLLFGDLKTPRVLNLIQLDRCPACYGVSVCPELYSSQILLETSTSWISMFNAKNIYYGYTRYNRRTVLKKLAHNWELKELDNKLCGIWGLKSNCKPIDIVNASNIDEKMIKLVQFNLTVIDLKPRKGLVMCPYSYSLFDFLQPVLKGHTHDKIDLFYVWTMLIVNPEPLILQAIPKSKGWPVPAYGGVCGRVEVVAYEGEPISSLMHVEWHRRLKYAKSILKAAMDFTFRHDRFRFYLMDWSLDNLVANSQDEITFVDLEDVIVLDKHISPYSDLPNWFKRYSKEDQPGFMFSIDNMCRHHLSDHNIWAACYVLAGDESPLLYPIPKNINDSRPHFDRLLTDCLKGDDRFGTVTKLQQLINDMLVDEKVVGYGSVR